MVPEDEEIVLDTGGSSSSFLQDDSIVNVTKKIRNCLACVFIIIGFIKIISKIMNALSLQNIK